MPSASDGRSGRSALLVIVFQLGICTIVLGDVANAVRGSVETIPGVAQLVGGVTAAGALLTLLARLVSVGGVDDLPE
jgi:hypothetical protein